MASSTAYIRTRVTSVMCAALLAPGDLAWTQQPAGQQPATVQPAKAEAAKVLSADQLDSLVAPIALYPDPLLAQVLAASTYPLEIVQLQQWLAKNTTLKDKALADAVQKQDWDPSIQSMAGLPEVVKQMADNIRWTAELGNAFLAQQSAVMDAVQRMRTKAKDGGHLKSNEQMKVETKVVESKTVVVIEQANPQVVYVPSYNPTVVWGAPIYAYPPVYYPPYGYYAAGMAISFGVGVAMGAMWGGGWGYGCGWGGNDININRNNNFNRNTNISGGNVGSGNRNWSHNPQHRGGASYGDRATANKFGGTARGDSLSNRQASARQNQSQFGGRQQSGISDRSSPGGGNFGGDRGGGNFGGERRSSSNQIGNRQVSGGDYSRGGGGGAFDGASRSSGSQARSSSSRGSSSFGGGGYRGGGGGGRGGGGRRR